MLTKNDLRMIGELVDSKLEEKLEAKLKPINGAIRSLENRMIEKFNEVVNFFEDRIIDHETRINTLENQVLTSK